MNGNGKELCKLLKSIRLKMATMYAIPYHPKECTHEGDCPGTCPQCDAELKYLTKEIKKLIKQSFTIDFDILTDEEKAALAMTLGIEENPPRDRLLAGIPVLPDDGEPEPEVLMGDVAPDDIIEWQEMGNVPDETLDKLDKEE